jgi:acetyl esterase/lipase
MTISPQAQAFLSSPPPFEARPLPAIDDKAGWRAYVEEADRGLLGHIRTTAERHPCKVTTHALAAAPLYQLTPESIAPENDKRAILYIHGGGFMMGGGEAAMYAATPIAARARTRTFSVDYRMPPDHPFPAGLDDSVEAYGWLLERFRPEHVAVYGPSAGGGLAPACILKAQALGLPLPGACVVHSPAADATESGDTYETNDTIDIVLKHRTSGLFALYANGHDLRDPLISPVFADYSKGFPPTLLTSGTRDLLLSSTVLLHRALRRAGVKAELHVWEAMTHAIFFDAPEEDELLGEQIRFMLEHTAGG